MGLGATVRVAGGSVSTARQAGQAAKAGNTTFGVCVTPDRSHVSHTQVVVCDTWLTRSDGSLLLRVTDAGSDEKASEALVHEYAK